MSMNLSELLVYKEWYHSLMEMTENDTIIIERCIPSCNIKKMQ